MNKVQLGEIFQIARGRSPYPLQKFITDSSDGINWVMIADASEGSKYISTTKKKILESGVRSSRMVYSGDLLLTCSMSRGKPYIMKTSGCIHSGWLVLNPQEEIDRNYFYYLLSSDVMYREFSRRARGTTVKGLTIDLVKSVKVSLPPIAEQKRIAAILDKADAVRRKRRDAIRLTEELLRSVFSDMFGKIDSQIKSIEELINEGSITYHKDGNHGSKYPRSKDFKKKGVPFLSANCFQDNGAIVRENIKYLSPEKAKELKIGLLQKGDVLLAHNATVGRVAIYTEKFERALVGTSLTIFRCNEKELDSSYLMAALKDERFQSQLFSNMSQSTRNQVPITAQRKLLLPYPPLPLQKKYSKIQIDIIKHQNQLLECYQESEDLFNSLLQRAFTGNL